MSEPRPVRTRVAPSPTGDPHVGTAYQALFNRAFARHHGGSFVLRIEDTDRERSSRESEAMIFRALRWLDLTWDEGPDVGGPHGPYRQSERAATYREHAADLIDRGAAYRCFCTAERLTELRAARQARGEDPRYDRACAGLDPVVSARRAAGEPHVVRLRVPADGTTTVRDELRGDVPFQNALIDDQVLIKSDGFPTYHLANVVDDRLMEISHVIRGEEWLPSTPKHVLLYAAFGWDPPCFIHTPLLRNPDRSKFSKRKNPTSLEWYREQGYLPEAMVNFLAQLGWSHPEELEFFDQAAFVERFGWDRMSLAGPIFDMAKLAHVNGLWIRSLTPEELCDRILDGGFTRFADAGRERLTGACELVRERLDRLAGFDGLTEFLFETPSIEEPTDLLGKKGTPAQVRALLADLRRRFDELEPWDAATVELVVREAAERSELKKGDALMATRVAVTGRKVSTPLFETVALLTRDEVLRRLAAAEEAA